MNKINATSRAQNSQLNAPKQQKNMPKVSFGQKDDSCEFSTKSTEKQTMGILKKATGLLMLVLALHGGLAHDVGGLDEGHEVKYSTEPLNRKKTLNHKTK